MGLYKLEALQVVTANSFGGHVDALADRFLAASSHYLKSTAPGGSTSFIAAFQAMLVLDVAATTVTVNASTGKVLITWGSGSHSYTWASTVFRDLLGFTGNLGSAPSHESTKQSQLLWLPGNVLPSKLTGSLASRGLPECDSNIRRAQSGKPWGTRYNEYVTERLRFHGLTKNLVWLEDETTGNQSLERFWRNFLSKGTACRVYTDRTSDTSYQTVSGVARDYKLKGPFVAVRLRENLESSWSVTLDFYGA